MTNWNRIDWSIIQHFSPHENWGDIEQVNPILIKQLDDMRKYANHPFILHEVYSSTGHTKNSYHYYGAAADGHFIESFKNTNPLDLIDQYFLAVKIFGNSAIGLYGRDIWNNPGIHVDIRPYIARWACTKMNSGKEEYLPLNRKYIDYIIENKLT